MNTRLLLLASALAVSCASAFAVEAEQWSPPAGSLTRAEVRAELARARAAGEWPSGGESYSGYATPAAVHDPAPTPAAPVAASAHFRWPPFDSQYVGG